MKLYLLWVDYGSEGWFPYDFDTLEEMLAYIRDGVSGPFLTTKRLDLIIREEP